jgi:hypothetical protein
LSIGGTRLRGSERCWTTTCVGRSDFHVHHTIVLVLVIVLLIVIVVLVIIVVVALFVVHLLVVHVLFIFVLVVFLVVRRQHVIFVAEKRRRHSAKCAQQLVASILLR